MSRSFIGILLAIILAVASAPAVQASTLQEGTWSGAITQSDGSVETVTFEVTYSEGQLSVAMKEDEERVSLNDERFEEGMLAFSWSSGGAIVDCVLESTDDGGYQGNCYQPGGNDVLVEIKMSPPAG